MDVDVVVIGSGAGGLSAAVAMARAGLRVLVLEQHYLPGGWCHSFTLEGYRFSPGVHYVGELGEGQSTRRLFEGLGLGADLAFYPLEPDGFEHVLVGDDRFDVPAGRAALEARLARRFPAERRGIAGYLDTLERTQRELGGLMGAATLGELARGLVGAPTVLRWAMATGRQLIDHFVRDRLLAAILGAQAGDYGLPPRRVSAAVHAGVAAHYLDGGWYPRGGGHALPRALIRALRRAGGRIRVRAEVTRILVEKGRAIGVRLADGTEIRSRWVVSNADPRVTFERLVGREHLGFALRRKLARTEWSVSNVSIFLAAELDTERLGLDSGNYWYYATPDIDAVYERAFDPASLSLERLPGFFLTITTLKDPSKRRGNRHTLEAFTLITHEAFARWQGTRFGDRPPDYAATKAEIGDRVVASLERVVPGLARAVVFREVGTPLTNEHYVAGTLGAMYGTAKLRSQVGPWSYPTRTPIEGLVLCGASTSSHGVAGAAHSGIVAARSVTRLPLAELLGAGGPPITILSRERPGTAEPDGASGEEPVGADEAVAAAR